MQSKQSTRTPAATGAARKPFAVGDYVRRADAPDTLGIVRLVTDPHPADGTSHLIIWTDGTLSDERADVLRRAPRPLGFILYEGPSLIDGAPIVAIVNAIDASANEKTGALVQSFILRADVDPMEALRTGADASVCGQCPHRPALIASAVASAVAGGASPRAARAASAARCYVNVGRAPLGVWQAYRRGRYVRAAAAFIAAAVAGRLVRLGTYGDPAAVPAALWRALVSLAAGRTGYSHQWHAIDAREWAPLVMASVDSAAERDAARALGYRTFRVSVDASDRAANEVQCPAAKESGARVQCADCLLCGGTTKQAKDVRILDHAPGWQARRVIAIRAAA
jgi:hypothetical protein